MRLNYLGPLQLAGGHPVAGELNPSCFTPSCYLVEVSDEARSGGELMEGDVLVVDEARACTHEDWVVAEVEGDYRLFKACRVGSRCRLLPASGGNGLFAHTEQYRGVVVRQARQYAV